jgi:predicted dehydrogenase
MAEYHVKKFAALPGVIVSACADRHAAHARDFARRLRIPRWYGSALELAGSGDVDCAATAVVDSGHAAAALAILQRGIPIFAEKPLARTLPEAEHLLAASRAAGVPAVVNFSKRNAPAVALARRLVAEGRIGRLTGGCFTYLQSWLLQDSWGRWDATPRWQWRVSAGTSTDGVIGDLLSHLIDTVRYVVGEIESATCAATFLTPDPDSPGGPGAADSCAAQFRLQSGALIAARASWRAAGYLDALAIDLEGDAGSITVDLAESRDGVKLRESSASRWTEIHADPCPSTYEQFISAVRGGEWAGPCFEDGVAVQRVIDACSRSAREPADVPGGFRGADVPRSRGTRTRVPGGFCRTLSLHE